MLLQFLGFFPFFDPPFQAVAWQPELRPLYVLVEKSAFRLPMIIALFALFHCLAFFVNMFASSMFTV